MITIFTGNGKGKTTAALGVALRAVGAGKKVLMVQFIKGPFKSGEDESHKRLEPDFKIVKKGRGFVGIGNDFLPKIVHRNAALEALEYAKQEALSKQWQIIILDEIWNALHLDLLTAEEVDRVIEEIEPLLENLVLTGRDCPKKYIYQAGLVTEMKEVKHPFVHGKKALRGLEY